ASCVGGRARCFVRNKRPPRRCARRAALRSQRRAPWARPRHEPEMTNNSLFAVALFASIASATSGCFYDSTWGARKTAQKHNAARTEPASLAPAGAAELPAPAPPEHTLRVRVHATGGSARVTPPPGSGWRPTASTLLGLRSLAWWGDDLVDWLGGQRVALDGAVQRFGVGSTYRFDSALGVFDLSVTFEAPRHQGGRLARWNG